MDTGETLVILADFNGDIMAGLCRNDRGAPALNARAAALGQVLPALLNPGDPVWGDSGTALIWTRPEGVSDAFGRARLMHPLDEAAAMAEVDAFCDAVLVAAKRLRTIFVACWHLPAEQRGYGMLDHVPGTGLRALVAAMNRQMADRLSIAPGVFILDSARWFERSDPVDAKMWYAAKVPFGHSVFKAAISDIKAALRGLGGVARKVVICDLDDTLWGGIVGDDGWQNLRLGGHDPLGEAMVDFQHELKALTRRGVVLAIASKNSEDVALEAIEKHPEMVLGHEDFAAWRINWQDKAANIVSLMEELNLGLQSAVFLDDNPAERARVAEALPDVLVPELPRDKLLYPGFLRQLDCFDTPAISAEDRARAAMYGAERARLAARPATGEIGSLDDWLKTLEIRVDAAPLAPENARRTGQLFNKTNQMNLRTRRMTEAELTEWAGRPDHALWTYRVTDRFGEAGLTGIASLAPGTDGTVHVTDFILSCRVMGKRIEETMVRHLCDCARARGATRLVAEYIETPKNAPMLEFWRRSGFAEDGGRFEWNLEEPYPLHDAVTLTVGDEPHG